MEAIKYVQRRRVGLYLDPEGNLRAYPANRLDSNLRSFIRDHKAQIVAVLQAALEEPVLDITVGNILALSPEEREEYHRELLNPPPDEPFVEHGWQAYRRAMQELQPADVHPEGTDHGLVNPVAVHSWILTQLNAGPVPASEIVAKADAVGIDPGFLEDVRSHHGIETTSIDGVEHWQTPVKTSRQSGRAA